MTNCTAIVFESKHEQSYVRINMKIYRLEMKPKDTLMTAVKVIPRKDKGKKKKKWMWNSQPNETADKAKKVKNGTNYRKLNTNNRNKCESKQKRNDLMRKLQQINITDMH